MQLCNQFQQLEGPVIYYFVLRCRNKLFLIFRKTFNFSVLPLCLISHVTEGPLGSSVISLSWLKLWLDSGRREGRIDWGRNREAKLGCVLLILVWGSTCHCNHCRKYPGRVAWWPQSRWGAPLLSWEVLLQLVILLQWEGLSSSPGGRSWAFPAMKPQTKTWEG